MERKPTLQRIRNLIGSFIEEEGADAIVVIYSKVKARKTETYLIPFGNAHTCEALINYAYDTYDEPGLESPEEDEDEDDD